MIKVSKFFLFCLYLGFALEARCIVDVECVTTSKGLKFLFVRDCDLPKVSMNISFKGAGYAYESAEKRGLSWFVSLFLQEGAGENDGKDFEKLENKGISLNFTTSLETFNVSLNALSENSRDAISLLSDAIIRPKIYHEGLNRVFEKVKVNFNNSEKDPYFIASKELGALLFKKHPYSRDQYGTLNSIMSITRDDILKYMRRNFAKDNIVISVVGCITKEEVSTLLDQYLSKLQPKRSKVRKISVKDEFGPAESKSFFMDIPQSVIFFAQRGIPYEDYNYYNYSVLVSAIGGVGLNSILMRELRQNLGITYNINASNIPNKHGSILLGSMNTDACTANKAMSAVKSVFSRVKNQGIDAQLFKDTKIGLVNNFIFSILSNNVNMAMLLHDMQVNDREVENINNYIDIINSVQLEEVNNLASSMLDPKSLFFVKVGRR